MYVPLDIQNSFFSKSELNLCIILESNNLAFHLIDQYFTWLYLELLKECFY